MASRRDRARRIRANRQMARLERGYMKALHKYQRATARLVSQQTTVEGTAIVIDDRRSGLVALIKTWMKRVLFLFGPQVIDDIQRRSMSGLEAPGSASFAEVERRASIDTFTENVLLWLEDYALQQATTINGTLKETARRVLIDAFEEGLGERETAKRLAAKVGGSTASTARIARTEIHTAANIGSDEAAKSTGVDMVKEWATTEDSRARPTHVEADGQRREMDEPFSVGGYSLDFPGDPKGPAREIINCRCVALYHPRINGVVFD